MYPIIGTALSHRRPFRERPPAVATPRAVQVFATQNGFRDWDKDPENLCNAVHKDADCWTRLHEVRVLQGLWWPPVCVVEMYVCGVLMRAQV